METQAYLEKMKSLQKSFLLFLLKKSDHEENFQNLIQLINDYKIKENSIDLKIFLRMISVITENNQHLPNYFDKIKSVLNHIKTEIKQTFSNLEIFKLFKVSNRLLLFLIEDDILVFDEPLLKKINYSYYLPFFFPELKPFLDENQIEKYSKEIPENFEEKRKLGENDNYICELIRNDKIDEFTDYINKNNYQIDSKLKNSIFETNHFIELKTLPLQGSSTLIEYAAFFGSVQIFKYLYSHNVQMKPKLLTYAIHGANMEIIHMLEKNKALFEQQKKKGFSAFKNEFGEYEYDMYDLLHFNHRHTIQEMCLTEAICSHQNEIARYISKKWFKKKDDLSKIFTSKSFKSLNFEFIGEYFNNDNAFYYLCKYDYCTLVRLLLKNKKMNISKKAIQTKIVLMEMFSKVFI